MVIGLFIFFFFKQKTAYDMRISDWSSDVCSSDLTGAEAGYYIPDRLMEGYGPSAEALVRLGREGAGLIVTVDCGAQAFEALSAARDSGVEVIVVDHHQCSTALPPAVAIVNPNRLDRSEEHTSERQSLMRIPYAGCCLKKK